MKTKLKILGGVLLSFAVLGVSLGLNVSLGQAETKPLLAAEAMVISPNGGEVYVVGQEMEILFVNQLTTLTGIRLKNSNGYYYDFEWMGAKDGNNWDENAYPNNVIQRKTWKIPADVELGQYKVEIKAINPFYANRTQEVIMGGDSSDNYFTITDKNTKSISRVKVISPNGGEKWQIGNEYVIKWEAPYGDSRFLHVDLYKGGKFVKNLINAGVNESNNLRVWPGQESSMVWTPDKSLIPGDDYKIRISSFDSRIMSDNKHYDIWIDPNYDESDNYFSIVSGGVNSNIQVISPNGGEKWQIGNEYVIRWKEYDRISSKIDLYKGGIFVKNLLNFNDFTKSKAESGMTYSMVWTPDTSLVPGSDYKIRVTDYFTNGIIAPYDVWKMPNYDESDNYFSIVKVPVPPTPPVPPCYNQHILSGITEGSIIQAVGDPDIYIVKYVGCKAYKRLILSPSVFKSYGHLKWENIIKVSNDTLNNFTTSNLVRSVKTGAIYKLTPSGDMGVKQTIKNAVVMQKLGFDQSSIYEINGTDENSYAQGRNIE